METEPVDEELTDCPDACHHGVGFDEDCWRCDIDDDESLFADDWGVDDAD